MADEAPLTVDEAVNLLRTPEPVEAPATAAESAPEAAEPEEIDASTPEADDTSEAQEPGDDVQAEEPEPEPETVQAVEAPHRWDADQKALFSKLPPETQAIIAGLEAQREQVTEKAKGEAAAARKAAETEAQQAQGVLTALSNVVPTWVETFKSRWDNIDWQRWAREDPSAYVAGKAEFDAEQAQLNQALQTQQLAQQNAQQAFYRERAEQLPALAPELADPVKGEERLTELSQYLLKEGFDADTIRGADARMMKIAWKALKADKALSSITRPRPTPAPQKPGVAPAAAPTRTSAVRSVEQISARLNKSGSVEDAVALLQARRK